MPQAVVPHRRDDEPGHAGRGTYLNQVVKGTRRRDRVPGCQPSRAPKLKRSSLLGAYSSLVASCRACCGVAVIIHCFLKCSQTSSRLSCTIIPASSQEVSPSPQREPALPAPQANFCPDEATTGTPVPKRRASSLMFREALTSRSCTIPHYSQPHSRSESIKSCLIQPQL